MNFLHKESKSKNFFFFFFFFWGGGGGGGGLARGARASERIQTYKKKIL